MTHVLILAAGRGTRMGGDLPKVLTPVHGRPIIECLLANVQPVCPRPTIVVGFKGEEVIARLGNSYQYAWQREQLGTAHAVGSAREVIQQIPGLSTLVVLYGDHPLVTAATVRALAAAREGANAVAAMTTVQLPDFEGDRCIFRDWSRVIRDAQGKIIKVVEVRDATAAELQVTEVNPSFYGFDPAWLWATIDRVGNQNAKGEYYLTDMVSLALADDQKIVTVPLGPEEAMGANTPAEVAIVEAHLRE
ncbi:MAG: NTP transferase domain-containing protein [Candidatus Liptonbacteria bacterium]|nr:NTP transferase domain-containing protein [Candidatus Liptonbacteria bacterium]